MINIPQRETQCKRILEYLQTHKGITPLEALEVFGCMRLSGRIKDLRNMGYLIETDIIHQNGKRFARYELKGHINDYKERL